MATVDVKVRRKESHQYYNKDIAFEERTLMEERYTDDTGKPGWYYKIRDLYLNQQNTDKCPVIAYCWENENESNLEPIGYLIPFTKDFYEWYEDNKHKYPTPRAYTKTEIGNYWWTKNRVIPIHTFPDGFIVKFNPKVCLSYFTQQSKLKME